MSAHDVIVRRRNAADNGWEEVLVPGKVFGFAEPEGVLSDEETAALASGAGSGIPGSDIANQLTPAQKAAVTRESIERTKTNVPVDIPAATGFPSNPRDPGNIGRVGGGVTHPRPHLIGGKVVSPGATETSVPAGTAIATGGASKPAGSAVGAGSPTGVRRSVEGQPEKNTADLAGTQRDAGGAATIRTVGPTTYSAKQFSTKKVTRDPSGANRTDKIPSAGELISAFNTDGKLAKDGDEVQVELNNAADGNETITLEAGAGVKLPNPIIVTRGETVKLNVKRVNTTMVEVTEV